MSRSLPISGNADHEPALESVTDAAAGDARSAALTGTVQVFDPAMCCETGVCGPGVDPQLLALVRDLRWLTAQGVSVERYGLTRQPAEFVRNPRVAGLMQAFGDAALPTVLVNGLVRWYGRYPNRAELEAALREQAIEDANNPDRQCDCSTPGAECC